MKVKICGLRTAEDAAAVAAAGVELAGLIFVPGTRRFLTLEAARPVRAALGAVEPVGVFRDASAEDILSTVDALELRWVQLHGSEPLGTVRQVAARCRLIRSVLVTAIDELDVAGLAPLVAAFLVDGAQPGSGVAVDHRPATRDRFGGRPFFVAGGLGPDNVADVVTRVRPDGVDVATGVTSEGRLCPIRLASFVQRARAAARETS